MSSSFDSSELCADLVLLLKGKGWKQKSVICAWNLNFLVSNKSYCIYNEPDDLPKA